MQLTDYFKYPMCFFTIVLVGLVFDAGKHLQKQANNQGDWSIDFKSLFTYLLLASIGGAAILTFFIPPSIDYFSIYVLIVISCSIVRNLYKR